MSKRREIGGSRTYRPWKAWDIDDTVTGTFIEQYVDNFSNPGYVIEIESCSFHNQEDVMQPGDYFGMNSNGSINFKFEKIEEGSKVEMVYAGKSTLSKGKFAGKEFHDVKVFLLDDDETAAVPRDEVELTPEEAADVTGL